jgi:catechol 1,2-dioxygenase
MKRREFVKNSGLTAMCITAFGTISWNGKIFTTDSETTTDILGPYYRPGAPMRSNLIPPGTPGEVMHVSGTIFQKGGKLPLANALIESWQCDAQQKYDNVSEDYLFRGAIKTGKDGRYAFKTIVPVAYKGGEDWRPAHIHLRVSSNDHQDLITQIYFKGDPHIEKDASAKSPTSVNRILKITRNSSHESMVKFDIVMGKSFSLDDAGFKKITGLYKLKNGMAEFNRQDDLLFLKMNGQLMEGMLYKGNNTFEGGMGFNRAEFQLLPNGEVKVTIALWDFGPSHQRYLEQHEGIKVLKYGN